MNQALTPTPQQYLDLHDMASDTLWQLEIVAVSALDAGLDGDDLRAAVRAILTVCRASELFNVQGIGELRTALKNVVVS